MPRTIQMNVARNIGLRQGVAPICRRIKIDGFPSTAPNALIAVIGFQRTLKCDCGLFLHLRINRCPNRHPAREKFILAKRTADLSADFIGEIIARWQGLFKTFEIAVLNRPQGLGFFGFIGCFVQISVLPHLA